MKTIPNYTNYLLSEDGSKIHNTTTGKTRPISGRKITLLKTEDTYKYKTFLVDKLLSIIYDKPYKRTPTPGMKGKAHKTSSKKTMAEKKKGKKNPKFSGLYIVHHRKFYSSSEAAAFFAENARTIIRKCKAGQLGSEYYFVPISEPK